MRPNEIESPAAARAMLNAVVIFFRLRLDLSCPPFMIASLARLFRRVLAFAVVEIRVFCPKSLILLGRWSGGESKNPVGYG